MLGEIWREGGGPHLAISTGTSLLEVAVATHAVLVLWQPPLHLRTVTWVGVSWSMVVLVGQGTITTLSLGLQAEVDLREEEMWAEEQVTGVSGEGASMDSEQEGPATSIRQITLKQPRRGKNIIPVNLWV